MNKTTFIALAAKFLENSNDNYLGQEIAISDKVVGVKIFDDPVFGFASADDNYFEVLKSSKAIGDHFVKPAEWLPEATTVISFFLPFSETIRKSNYCEKVWPSEGWVHGRVEGQALIDQLCRYLQQLLQQSGYLSIIPGLDGRFYKKLGNAKDYSDQSNKHQLQKNIPHYSSNWSERHVAFICGLGTFGLSKGLITAKGIAGRFGSLVTNLYFSPTKREYEDIYDYCTQCGACALQCPVNAISIKKGKDHVKCFQFLRQTAEKFKPRYGCGKCQVNVPCEHQRPC